MNYYADYLSIYDDRYGVINFRNKDVIDAGAFIGDTTIYFIMRGANRVVAIEPHPKAFRELVRNIKLNGLNDRVIPINAALSSITGSTCVSMDLDLGSIMATYFGPVTDDTTCTSDVKIRLITLGEVINETRVRTDVLKMNCEGCEYDVILNDYEHVRLFRELVFEYHRWVTGIPVKELLRVLSRDFKCDFIGRAYEDYGYVYCQRIT
ncbi:FkbM family methyltransferase [Vulcanisaeta distributa]|uniref:FkbM family methyltransferase n=1 Tax=Vulcanisaeta distributa TaxID=164451 RepID=UPI0006CFF33B|nr:FkbM family methyltransferase [Vulcanisaeta distributa]